MSCSAEERFWSRVDKTESCWLWTGTKTSDGFATFWYNNKSYTIAQVAWQMAYGPIPKGMRVHASCGNRLCVNPSHLFLGPGKGGSKPGEKCHLALLTDKQVLEARRLFTEGTTAHVLGEKYGVHYTTIKYALLRKTWRHLPALNVELSPGDIKRRIASEKRNVKLTADQVVSIRKHHRCGVPTSALAKTYGVTKENILLIVQRKTWKHI
jgi:hypothetical protein